MTEMQLLYAILGGLAVIALTLGVAIGFLISLTIHLPRRIVFELINFMQETTMK